MPIGSTTPPNIMLSTAFDVRPEMELTVQGDVKSFIGKPVRVTVYDQTLFQHGNLKSLFLDAFSRFQGFNADQVVPEKLRFPSGLIGDGSNGILLTLVLPVIDEVPGNSNASRWTFGPATERTEAKPAKQAVEIDFILRDINLDRQVRAAIHLPFSRLTTKRRLVVILERPDTHEILYSNAWTQQPGGTDLHKRNMLGGPTIVNTAATDAAIAVKIGSTGIEVGAPSPQNGPAPSEDITGIYEAFTKANERPGDDFPVLSVQLNQAGSAVAGWIAPIKQVTQLAQLQIPTSPPLTPYKSDSFGVLFGHFDQDVQFNWGHTNRDDDPRFELVQEGTGTLIVESADACKLTFVKGDQERTLFLRKVEPVPRTSNDTVAKIVARNAQGADAVKQLFLGQQVQPVPLRFFEVLIKDFDPDGQLGSLIIQQQTSTGTDRIGPRDDISKYLLDLGDDSSTLDSVVAYFTRLSASSIMEIDVPDKASPLPPEVAPTGKVKHSVYEWLQLIVLEQLDALIGPPGNQTPDQAISNSSAGFRLFGLTPKGGSVYRIEFFPIGGEIPTKVKLGAYRFEARVKKFNLGSNGKAGSQDTSTGFPLNGKKMSGWFGDIGVALDAKFKKGGGSVSGGSGGSNFIMAADFPTFHQLTPADFNSATFYTISAAGPSFGIGVMSLSSGSSAVMVMTVKKLGLDGAEKDSVRLIAGIDEGPSGPSLNSQVIKKPDVKAGENPIKPKLGLASLSFGWGYMSETEPTDFIPPAQDDPPHQPDPQQVQRIINIFFRKQSSSIEGRSLAGFEEALAVERALFVTGGGLVTALGHCSPEGSDNEGLSQRRADAAITAIRNAFGKRFTSVFNAFGKGDSLAVQTGFPKPSNPNQDPNVDRKYQELEKTVYPLFRLVELDVEGAVSFVLKTQKVSASD